MENYTTVFLFTDRANEIFDSYSDTLACNAAWLLFLLFILLALIVARKESGAKPLIIIFAILLIIWTGGYLLEKQSKSSDEYKYQQLLQIYESHQYKIVEGEVHLIEMAHSREHGDFINIGGVDFEIGQFSGAFGNFGYRDTIANNGVLKEGIYARIYYYNDGLILRIDIKEQ